ncbi:hypothetical protein PORY_002022 [Pneumocystis oryctolagi]|uniref:Uncharacterized protein n=1 Tax=Pneumocystis oryctolagi TaxID=42067 RepID=A0ACB7CA87_9ASCO|nr:hypothetical protein PORY_002022 [Pneumocystis oryctolagi]
MQEPSIFMKKLDEILMNSQEWDLKNIINSSENVLNNQKENSNIQKISIEKYVENNKVVNELNNSVASCNKALDSIESYLLDFQNNLRIVNNEIESLKKRSSVINQQLQIRKNTEKRINNVINNVFLSPETIFCISESKIDEKWLHNLSILDNILELFDINKKKNDLWEIQKYMENDLEKLSWIAIARIREFLLSKIKILLNSYSNSRAIHQLFIKYKFLYFFLFKRQSQIASEIKQVYQNTIQWYYSYHFEKYRIFLEKLKMNIFDTIISNSEKTSKKNNVSFQKKSPFFSSYQEFNIGIRINIISEENIIMTHISNDDKKIYNVETIFYSYNQVLVNSIILEYLFLSEFMLFNDSQKLNNYLENSIRNIISDSKTFNQRLLENSHDIIGILLCIKITEKLSSCLKNKEVYVLNNYIDEIFILLWNQFEKSIDLHCEVLKQMSINNSLSKNYNKTAPDLLTQKVGDLINGIFILFPQTYNKLLETNVEKLVNDLVEYLSKISDKIKNQKEQELFLYNNYSLILTIISNTEGYSAEKQQKYFRDLQLNIKKS